MSASKSSRGITARHERSQSGRLDNFVDGTFAFAITLLVISGASLPRTVDALIEALRGVPAFAVCFAQLAWLWHGHVRWRETFASTDNLGVCLSLLLVFFALIFVFPLHLVYASFFHGISDGALSPRFVPGANSSQLYHLKSLFACYGLSYACMGGTLSALFVFGGRGVSGLSRAEVLGVRTRAVMWAFVACVGLLSMLIALLGFSRGVVVVAGFTYMLLALTGVVVSLSRRFFEARLPS